MKEQKDKPNNEVIISSDVLKLLATIGREGSIGAMTQMLMSEKYTLIYTTRDSEVYMRQVDDVPAIEDSIKKDYEDGNDSGWELEYIFHKGKNLKYRINTTVSIKFF